MTDDLDGLVERLLLRTLTASDREATAAAIIRLREERDSARSEASHVAKMFMRQRDVLLEVRDKIADEGDRCYFGSTNQADDLRAVVQELDNYAWDRYMRAVKWPDYIEASRKAHARAEAAEAALAKAREALKPFADIAVHYDPDEGDNNQPLWGENHLKIGDLRRARAALKGE